MKEKYIHMAMLIQGPRQPGNDINLYLGLLKEELHTLWTTPAKTWDASKGEYFYMRAALITTVQDYLGYDYLSGQVYFAQRGVSCRSHRSLPVLLPCFIFGPVKEHTKERLHTHKVCSGQSYVGLQHAG